jgi:hypothetical protein
VDHALDDEMILAGLSDWWRFCFTIHFCGLSLFINAVQALGFKSGII